jgi:hypothetical protein
MRLASGTGLRKLRKNPQKRAHACDSRAWLGYWVVPVTASVNGALPVAAVPATVNVPSLLMV